MEGSDAEMGYGARAGGSVALSACVQTRQYADVQFTPPEGDYKLLVLRPDVTVGSLTTGGMVEPRADWTEQARTNIVAALRAQQAARGGKLTDRRAPQRAARRHRAGTRRRRAAELRGRPVDRRCTNISATICRPSAARASTGRSARTRCGSARRPATIMPCSSTPRTRSRRPAGSRSACSALAGCFVGFCAPNVGGADAARLCLAGRPQDRRSGVVQRRRGGQPGAGDQVRRPAHAARRGADGRSAARPDEAGRAPSATRGGDAADVPALPRAQPPFAAGRRRRCRGGAGHRRRAGADPARGHGPAGRPRVPADREGRAGPVAGDGAGRGGDRGLQPADQGPEAHRLSAATSSAPSADPRPRTSASISRTFPTSTR